MKLSTRYNYINLASSIGIFLLASLAFYFLLHYVLIRQVDDDLAIEEHEIQLYVAKYDRLPEAMPTRDQEIRFSQADSADIGDRRRQIRTIIEDLPEEHHAHRHAHREEMEEELEEESLRQLTFFIDVNNQWYRVTVSKSLKDSNKMIQSVIFISLATVAVLFIVGLLINRLTLRSLWKPFYQSLAAMKSYRLGEARPVLVKSKIDEFNDLNETLDSSVTDAEGEYRRLKEFTENASHELQTPLAIIRSKLDVLIQDEHLSAAQGATLQSAYDAVARLARLNESLLLLNRIENRQFSGKTQFNLKHLVEQKVESFREIWDQKKMKLVLFTEDCGVSMNGTLAEVMLNNLFSNATRHSPAGGIIRVELLCDQLTVANSALGGALDEERLFTRFYKGGQPTDSQGLGLSILRQVAVVSGFLVRYSYTEGEHRFSVLFNQG